MILGCRPSVGKNIFLNSRQWLEMIIRFLKGLVRWSKIHDGLIQTIDMVGYLGEQSVPVESKIKNN